MSALGCLVGGAPSGPQPCCKGTCSWSRSVAFLNSSPCDQEANRGAALTGRTRDDACVVPAIPRGGSAPGGAVRGLRDGGEHLDDLLFPAPFSPTSPRISPATRSSDACWNAGVAAKRFD